MEKKKKEKIMYCKEAVINANGSILIKMDGNDDDFLVVPTQLSAGD